MCMLNYIYILYKYIHVVYIDIVLESSNVNLSKAKISFRIKKKIFFYIIQKKEIKYITLKCLLFNY